VNELPDLLRQHLREPRLVGHAEPEHGRGIGRNAACGDELVLTVTVGEQGALSLRFTASACAAVVASASYAVEQLDGASVDELRRFDLAQRIDELGGLPRHRRHAVAVVQRALEALAAAISG
jgi:NifU-like protein involved in Fe-S cluster formation